MALPWALRTNSMSRPKMMVNVVGALPPTLLLQASCLDCRHPLAPIPLEWFGLVLRKYGHHHKKEVNKQHLGLSKAFGSCQPSKGTVSKDRAHR